MYVCVCMCVCVCVCVCVCACVLHMDTCYGCAFHLLSDGAVVVRCLILTSNSSMLFSVSYQ